MFTGFEPVSGVPCDPERPDQWMRKTASALRVAVSLAPERVAICYPLSGLLRRKIVERPEIGNLLRSKFDLFCQDSGRLETVIEIGS